MTLIETLVAMAISLIVIGAMVGMMANTLGTGSRAIEMTRLQQEMRASMQIVTRELRRANFQYDPDNPDADCFANIDCNPDSSKVKVVQPDGDCVQFWRFDPGDNELSVSSFQRITRGSVGVVQITREDGDSCGNDWGSAHDVTDSREIHVTAFTFGNESFNEVISEDGDSQTINKLRLTMTAQLRSGLQGGTVSRTIQDLVYVRNPVLCPAGSCP